MSLTATIRTRTVPHLMVLTLEQPSADILADRAFYLSVCDAMTTAAGAQSRRQLTWFTAWEYGGRWQRHADFIYAAKKLTEGHSQLRAVAVDMQEILCGFAGQASTPLNAGHNPGRPRMIDPASIVAQAAAFYHVEESEVMGKFRQRRIVAVRHICMYLLWRKCGLSSMRVGELLGKRDYTTVLYGTKKIESQLSASPQFAGEVAELTRKLLEAA